MTEEEYFRKHYPDVCYNGKPLSPYWDFFQDGVEFGERQSEKKITELKLGNRELKKLVQQREQRGLEVQEDLLKEKAELEKQVKKMKCCQNCKNCAYAGFEIICRTYDCVNHSKWEIKEND